jgi:hypothetical protein
VAIFFTNSEDWEKPNLSFGLGEVSGGFGREHVLKMHMCPWFAHIIRVLKG